MDSKHFLLLLSLFPASSLAAIGDIYVGCGDAKQCYGYFSNSCVDTVSLPANKRKHIRIKNV